MNMPLSGIIFDPGSFRRFSKSLGRPRLFERIPALLLAIILTTGCPAKSSSPDPAGAYRAFYDAASAGDWQRARTWLDDASKQALQRAAQSLGAKAERPGQTTRNILDGLHFQVTTPLREVKVVSRQPGRALLRIKAGTCRQENDCRQSEVQMVNTKNGWRVHAIVPTELTPRQSGE